MERYDSYKDSGVKWLGEIPSHWELRKSKYLWKENVLLSADGDKELLSVSQYEGVTPAKGDSRSESLKGYKVVLENDLVINIMLAWLGGLGVSKYNGLVSPAYCTYKMTDKFNPHFLHYLYKTPLYLAEFARHSSGIVPSRWRMYTDDFGQIFTLLPPPNEQDAIVSCLDDITSKIDKAIVQQQKMIDLLNERKQIIINNAVTKGLDPNVKMKDSGVEWIGEIPEHWVVKKMKYLLVERLMYGANESAESEDESYPRYIRITDIDEDGCLRPDTFRSLPPSIAEPYLLRKGDVLFARSGATAGKTYLFNEDIKACFAGYLIKARLKNSIKPEYLNYYTKSGVYENWKRSIFIQATIPNIGADKYANLQITLPSKNEQNRIIQYLDKKTDKILQVIKGCRKQISFLQERKQIIINDIVTGKVKIV